MLRQYCAHGIMYVRKATCYFSREREYTRNAEGPVDISCPVRHRQTINKAISDAIKMPAYFPVMSRGRKRGMKGCVFSVIDFSETRAERRRFAFTEELKRHPGATFIFVDVDARRYWCVVGGWGVWMGGVPMCPPQAEATDTACFAQFGNYFNECYSWH